MSIKAVVETKPFLNLEPHTQLLYFFLTCNMNQYCVVENVSKIVKKLDWFSKKYLKELKNSNFITDFDVDSVFVSIETYPFDC